jgi:hypothetical protein
MRKTLEYIVGIRKMRNAYKIVVGKPDRKRHLGDLGADEKITLRWILKKYGMKVWTGVNFLRMGTNGGFLYSMNGVEFLYKLSINQFLCEDSTPWSKICGRSMMII